MALSFSGTGSVTVHGSAGSQTQSTPQPSIISDSPQSAGAPVGEDQEMMDAPVHTEATNTTNTISPAPTDISPASKAAEHSATHGLGATLLNLQKVAFCQDNDSELAAQHAEVETERSEDDFLAAQQADLDTISKVAHAQLGRQPRSTRMILARQAAQMFADYEKHGSAARLSLNMLEFLEGGDVVTRQRTRKVREKKHQLGSNGVHHVTMNVDKEVVERAVMQFEELPKQQKDLATIPSKRDSTAGPSCSAEDSSEEIDSNEAAATAALDQVEIPPIKAKSKWSHRLKVNVMPALKRLGAPKIPPRNLSHKVAADRSDSTYALERQGVKVGLRFKPAIGVTGENGRHDVIINASLKNQKAEYDFSYPVAAQTRQKFTRPANQHDKRHTNTMRAARVSDVRRLLRRDREIPSLESLAPHVAIFDHDHQRALNVDSETHAVLANTDLIPFRPVDMVIKMSQGISFPPNALESLNRIFLLYEQAAKDLLRHLTLKYQPYTLHNPDSKVPDLFRTAPAPPLALFRLAVSQYFSSQIKTMMLSARQDELYMSPHVRIVLKDVYENVRRPHINPSESEVLRRVCRLRSSEAIELFWEVRNMDLHAWTALKMWRRARELETTIQAKLKGKY